ncbi:hypothetical protein J2743_001659 [Methanobacterium petrolearium]|nr:hypothetical protein [Methanobacterium petrolearium]
MFAYGVAYEFHDKKIVQEKVLIAEKVIKWVEKEFKI